MVSAAPASRGLKRICTSCGTRFYDMDKRPILCPSCGVEFSGDAKLKARRTRALVEDTAARPVEEEAPEKDVEIIGRDADVVGLEDVEEDNGDESDDDAEIGADLEELDELDDDEDLEEEIGVEVEDETER